MSNYEPKYEKGTVFLNNQTENRIKIVEAHYSRFMCDIVYKVQHLRYNFDMRNMPETVIKHGIENEHFEKVR